LNLTETPTLLMESVSGVRHMSTMTRSLQVWLYSIKHIFGFNFGGSKVILEVVELILSCLDNFKKKKFWL